MRNFSCIFQDSRALLAYANPMLGVFCSLALQAPLEFADALQRAELTPGLEAARSGVRQRTALASEVSSLTSNPLVMVQPGARLLSQGAVRPEVYVSIAQDFNLAAYGRKRREASTQEAQADAVSLLVAQHQQRLHAAAAWLALWSAQSALAAANQEHALADEWSIRVARAVATGGLTKIDSSVARSYAAEAQLAVLQLEGEAFALGLDLNRVLAVESAVPASVSDALPMVTPPASSAPGKLPALRVAEVNLEVDAARVREVEAMHGVGLQVGALGWREGGGDYAGVLTLQLTLPLFERSQRERSVQAAALARAQGEVENAKVEDSATRAFASHEVEHTAATLLAIKDALLPAALETLAATERKFALGDATAQDVVIARRAAMSARARLLRAQADATLACFRARELASFAAKESQ